MSCQIPIHGIQSDLYYSSSVSACGSLLKKVTQSKVHLKWQLSALWYQSGIFLVWVICLCTQQNAVWHPCKRHKCSKVNKNHCPFSFNRLWMTYHTWTVEYLRYHDISPSSNDFNNISIRKTKLFIDWGRFFLGQLIIWCLQFISALPRRQKGIVSKLTVLKIFETLSVWYSCISKKQF